jgi:hypothetical protein
MDMAKAQTAFLSARHSVSMGANLAGGLGLKGLKVVGKVATDVGGLAGLNLSSQGSESGSTPATSPRKSRVPSPNRKPEPDRITLNSPKPPSLSLSM